jgi:hypothetical protein
MERSSSSWPVHPPLLSESFSQDFPESEGLKFTVHIILGHLILHIEKFILMEIYPKYTQYIIGKSQS